MIAPMIRRLTCLSFVLAAAICAAAAADDPPRPLDAPLRADLDGDGTAETVRARETACFGPQEPTPPPCPPDGLRTILVEVTDACAGGERVLKLSREMEFISFARILDADRDGQRRELAFELRAGASARGVQAKIVSFRPGAGGCVAVRRTLFSYPRPETIGRRPQGTSFASGSLMIKDYSPRYRGLELRTGETYSRPRDPGCCPTFGRVTFWRFDTEQQRYRAFRTKLTRLPRPS